MRIGRRASLTDEVHVWWAATDEVRAFDQTDTFESWLTDDERERYRRYRRPEDRELFLFTRAALRHALSQYAGVEPGGWRFVTGEYGRPELDAPFSESGLRFNVSHTSGMIACLVSDGMDAGVDVEDIGRRSDILELARTVFSKAERRELEALPPDAAIARFYEIWTLKEAYVKARGMGLSLPVRKVTFTGGRRDGIGVSFETPIEDVARDWQFALWRPSPGHQGALALRRGAGGDRTIVFRPALAALVP